MAKDAKGHGSDARGGYPNIDRSAFRRNKDGTAQHVGYGDGTFRIAKSGGGYRATEQNTGESFSGNSLSHISQQLSARSSARSLMTSELTRVNNSDRAAAQELARGSNKSDAVPIHGGATGRS